MGPVISLESKTRIEALIAKGEHEGASVRVDGRGKKVKDYEEGFFVFPTVLDGVSPQGEIARTEIFGPVLSLMHASSLDEAIQMVNARSYGNMACIFTAMAPQRDISGTKSTPATSASMSAWPRLWQPSPSADGARASSATCTPRHSTASSFIPRRRS